MAMWAEPVLQSWEAPHRHTHVGHNLDRCIHTDALTWGAPLHRGAYTQMYLRTHARGRVRTQTQTHLRLHTHIHMHPHGYTFAHCVRT